MHRLLVRNCTTISNSLRPVNRTTTICFRDSVLRTARNYRTKAKTDLNDIDAEPLIAKASRRKKAVIDGDTIANSTPEVSPETLTKRTRKKKAVAEENPTEDLAIETPLDTSTKRTRRKKAESEEAITDDVPIETPLEAKLKRGRPKKSVAKEDGAEEAPVETSPIAKSARGRQKKAAIDDFKAELEAQALEDAESEEQPIIETVKKRKKKKTIEEEEISPAFTPLKLRSYQEEAIEAVLNGVNEGYRRLGLSLATGSGKTVIFTQLISRLQHPARPKEATRTLILAHRTELVEQAFRHCRRTYPDATIEIEMGNAHSSGQADITIASVASLISRSRCEKFDPSTFKLILIDEAHHAAANSYKEILDYFGALDMTQGDMDLKPIVVGVSATLSRADGLPLGKVLDHIVYHRGYVEMIEDNWLCPVQFTTVQTNVDLSRVKTSGPNGDFAIGELGRAVNIEQANELTVRTWMTKASQRKSTMVFCVDIAHVNEITATFRKYGIDARPVTSHTKSDDRRLRLDEFRNFKFPVLVNCGVFTEGTDVPNVDCILLARPTRSKNLLVQMIGRGMRLHESKKDCHIIDMVGNVTRGVITIPTLLGLDPDEILEGETMEGAKKRLEERKAEREAQGYPLDAQQLQEAIDPVETSIKAVIPAVTFTHYASIEDLLADKKQDSPIRTLSRLAWVTISPYYYILSTRGGDLKISITSIEDATENNPAGYFCVTETQNLPPELAREKNIYKTKPKFIAGGFTDLQVAVNAADNYAYRKFPRALLEHSAPWRRSPATEGQLKMLAKVISEQKAATLTKGQAGDMITRMKHGGIARFERIQTVRRKQEREEERERKRQEKVEVKVGAVAGSVFAAMRAGSAGL
ncbi:P-loop containing nucleoside triphosphate hydrolase protein [Pyronema omphalodes]|nr:P-loop containing nucleoside triphosphate hydrolase protein [Pyronema omphalodes]